MLMCRTEELERHFRAGKGVIAVTAHYGNWELGIHRISLFTEHPALIIYKPLHNKAFDTVYNAIRSRFGAIMVPMKLTLRKIIAYRHQHHISVFVADQTPGRRRSEAHTSDLQSLMRISYAVFCLKKNNKSIDN